jgi:hypothetical protein
MNIVLDTNVLVAGLLSPSGPCGEIVRMVSADKPKNHIISLSVLWALCEIDFIWLQQSRRMDGYGTACGRRLLDLGTFLLSNQSGHHFKSFIGALDLWFEKGIS